MRSGCLFVTKIAWLLPVLKKAKERWMRGQCRSQWGTAAVNHTSNHVALSFKGWWSQNYSFGVKPELICFTSWISNAMSLHRQEIVLHQKLDLSAELMVYNFQGGWGTALVLICFYLIFLFSSILIFFFWVYESLTLLPITQYDHVCICMHMYAYSLSLDVW